MVLCHWVQAFTQSPSINVTISKSIAVYMLLRYHNRFRVCLRSPYARRVQIIHVRDFERCSKSSLEDRSFDLLCNLITGFTFGVLPIAYRSQSCGVKVAIETARSVLRTAAEAMRHLPSCNKYFTSRHFSCSSYSMKCSRSQWPGVLRYWYSTFLSSSVP